MEKQKRYFWFKMPEDFFANKEIKKLRKIAGGDTYVIIYQKIILLSLKHGGSVYFEGIEDDFASEIALEIDEEEDNVRITLEFMKRNNSISIIDENEFKMNVSNLIGSETSTALRVRKCRERKLIDNYTN
jgi:predicted phage replisome organizer